MAFWILAAAVAVSIAISFLLRPRVPKRPDVTQDLENPTADAGRPIPVVFGTITVKGLNVLHFGDKAQRTHMVK
jgi:hypothetical protein